MHVQIASLYYIVYLVGKAFYIQYHFYEVHLRNATITLSLRAVKESRAGRTSR